LKNLLKILILTLILASCKKETEQKTKLKKSEFNLKTDITDFKKKMTESDTIKIWFDHSVCTYQGVERIEITKKSDLIKIRTKFKEDTFDQNPEWKIVYEKQIPITDTIWKMEEFFKRNTNRQKSEAKEYGTLQVSSNGNKIHYFTKGLVDLNRFMADYFETMKKIHPEDTNNIYGVEIIEFEDIKNGEIKETELETE
jgi:hypothetical protein